MLSNPYIPRAPLDRLKYIPLNADASSYVSLGANLRERLEVNNSPRFGLGSSGPDTYLLQRAQVSADARFGQHFQFFVQLEDVRAFGKNPAGPVDRNPLDLEQAFVAWGGVLGGATVNVRVGRQEMPFDLQRFLSVRDGPNVRQAFDGIWADYAYQKWRFMAYATQPVQYRDAAVFDDVSNRDFTFSGIHLEQRDVGPGNLFGYYARYTRSNAKFLDATGNEHRDVFDLRYIGRERNTDWDVESMLQTGHVGSTAVFAWAVGSLAGYTLDLPWRPRFGVQVDAASGDRHPGDGRLETFNPLFPPGYYFTLAGYTGYTNLVHIKPSVTLKPSRRLSLLAAVGLQWRATTADAVYAQSGAVVPGTAGRGTRWTGVYTQLRADWTIAANLIGSVEAVHFQVGDSIRSAGGSNADYLGIEVKYGW